MEITENEVIYVIEAMNNQYQMKYNRDPINYFLTGNCYTFSLALTEIFPEGVMMHNNGHVIFKLNDQLYDTRKLLNENDLKIFGEGEYIEDPGDYKYTLYELFPDDKKEGEDVLDLLIKSGSQARANYESQYLHKSK